jgi:amino acid adenylation domain-containing protein
MKDKIKISNLVSASKNNPLPIRGPQIKIKNDLIVRFNQHVITNPHAMAITTKDGSWTYQELFIEVIRFKALFEKHLNGITIVYLDRSPRLLPVLLALQWLELTYIPIDLSTPIDRLRAILKDSQAQAVLYDVADKISMETLRCLILDLSLVDRPTFDQINHQTQVVSHQHHIAYIIYTSGSTGHPKGVAISRLALNNFLTSMSHYFLNEDRAFLLAITSISFDIAGLELFLPIWQQKTLYLAQHEEHKDPFCIRDLLSKHPITHLQATPSMWKMLDGEEWPGKANLIALCGGEQLTQTLSQSLLPKVDQLWNMYGPTEATIWCSLKQIKPNEPITVGRPIHNMEMRVMDELNQILPPYVKGELYIGGVGLADKYVNNTPLTKNQFINCMDALGGRLYKVGDIACSTTDGEFLIFGRTDNQIKLHGYRIELEDIEAHIQTAPDVRNCAVKVINEQLIAFLSLFNPSIFSEVEFLNYLSKGLPDYMLPKRIIILDSFPLSINGKIDRKVLMPPPITSTHEGSKVSDLTPIQLTLSNIWAEELNVSYVGLHDNFFELGGHSLSATRITARVCQRFEKVITLKSLYTAPTVFQLSNVIENATHSTSQTLKLPRTEPRWFPLNDFQLMLWISTIFEPKLKKFNVGDRKRMQGPINKVMLDLALRLVFQKQEVLSYRLSNVRPIQKLSNYPLLAWQEENLTELDEETSNEYLRQSFDKLFHFHAWKMHKPLVVAKIFYLAHDEVELHICMSHLISDENSMPIFFQELSNAYLFYTHHTTLAARTLSQPFQAYAIQQHKTILNDAEIDASFWREYLSDAALFCFPEHQIIRTTKLQPNLYSSHIEIPENLVSKLHKMCSKYHLTVSDVLTAAVGLALRQSRDTNSHIPEQLVINTIKSTRSDPNFDNVLGCFLAIHPIKIDLKEHDTLLGMARNVQRSTLETSEHQRASSIVKIASIGHVPFKRRTLKARLARLLAAILSLLKINVHPSIITAISTLAEIDRKQHFLVNINILNNFITDKTSINKRSLFGMPKKSIPKYSYPMTQVDYVFDICFLREHNHHIPYVVITSNITSETRERIGMTLIEIIQNEDIEPLLKRVVPGIGLTV